jgi:hypothetical protein
MSQTIRFFALSHELLAVLCKAELATPLHYCRAGLFETHEVAVYGTVKGIPKFDRIETYATITCKCYLAAKRTRAFAYSEVQQRKGGIRYSIDQSMNPETVALTVGGLFDANTLLAGDIGTCTNSNESLELMKTYRRIIRSHWMAVCEFWVSPEAEAMLDRGARLTMNARASTMYDLRRP